MTQPEDNPNIEAAVEAAVEAGRRLFAHPVTFVKSVVALEHLPDTSLPEICFAGRSNVGKSSLINALCNQKSLARASNTPGRTRELNYFNMSDRLFLVDLPGYGYARASKTDIAHWTELTRDFLRGRAPLRRVFVLIDSRRGIMETDFEIMAMLDEAAVTYQIVLTKTDKLKKGKLSKVLSESQAKITKRPAAHPNVLVTSAEKKTGLEELKAEIVSLALSETAV
ncbi:MAG: YihA family ribosome biogenesis GTP-binding protein [Robiginitomaculum sp.]|nr:MAG: YihA family ribosome biogenesis GTP-binding protein [Robiginitomaculum sp.]